jgi:hypothetical protein
VTSDRSGASWPVTTRRTDSRVSRIGTCETRGFEKAIA